MGSQIILIGLIIVASSYVFLIIYLTYGWHKLQIFVEAKKNVATFVSIIVPVRNEEIHIALLLACLVKQDYPSDKFEIIAIDDHSEDDTVSKIFAFRNKNIFLHKLPQHLSGKKQAITYGVSKANGELIVTTDADCKMESKWLSTIVSFYNKYDPAMIVGPVVYEKNNKLFEKMQSLEFLSLIGSGAGAIGNNNPIMCNGANLAYKKITFVDDISVMENEVSSGDDMFLMLNLKSKKEKILFLKSRGAIITTQAVKRFQRFIQQRKRWVSKSRFYRDKTVIATSVIIFSMNIFLLCLFVASFLSYKWFYLFTVLLIIKLIVDFPILYSVTGFFKRRKLLLYFLPVQIFYFIYVGTIPILSWVSKYWWKERRLN